jgi:hypothetical protein
MFFAHKFERPSDEHGRFTLGRAPPIHPLAPPLHGGDPHDRLEHKVYMLKTTIL